MKKIFLILATISFISSSILMSCNSSAEKVKKAEDAVVVADSNLIQANQEYLTDVENYKKETADKILENEKNLAEFKVRIEKDKKSARAEYKTKIAELEQKNSDLKMRMDNYKVDSKEQWENFKSEFSHDMDEMGKAFKDLTVNNVKK
jgi:protein subunit release factor B